MDLPSFLPVLFSRYWPSSLCESFSSSKTSPLCLACSFFSSFLSPHFPSPPPLPRHLSLPSSFVLYFSSSSFVLFLVASSFPVFLSSSAPSSATSHSIAPTSSRLHYDNHLHRGLPSQTGFPSESASSHLSLHENTHSFSSSSSSPSDSSSHVPSTSDLPPSAILQILLPHQRSRAYSLESPWWLGDGSRWWFSCPSQVSDCCHFSSALKKDGSKDTRQGKKEKETGPEGIGCSPGFCPQKRRSDGEEDAKKKDVESVEAEWPSKERREQDLKGSGGVEKKGHKKEEQGEEGCTGGRRKKLLGGLLLSWSSHLPHKAAEVLLEEERKRCFLLLEEEEGERGGDAKAERKMKDFPSSLFPTCDERGGYTGQIFWDRMRYKELQRAAYLNEEFPPVLEVMLSVLLLFLLPFIFNKTAFYLYVLLYGNKVCLVKEREGERVRERTQERESQGKSSRLEKIFSWLVLSSLPLPSSLRRFVSNICEFSFEFLFLVLPLLLAYCLPEMLLPVTIGVITLAAVFSFFSSFSSSSTSSWNGLAPQKGSVQQLRPFQRSTPVSTLDVDSRGCIAVLTEFRGMLTIATCIAILGVDFFIFPRSLAKTCIFGLSLMDLGVGCFVFGSGLVSPEARRFQRTLKDTSRRREGKRNSSVEKGSVLSRRKDVLNPATRAQSEEDDMQRDNAVEQKRREGEDDQEAIFVEKRNRDDCCFFRHPDDTTRPRTFDLVWLWNLLWSFLFCNTRRKTREPNERGTKRDSTRRGENVFWRAARRSGVLGILGFFRFLLLLLCDYHTPETEYGLHWNFYLTLMVVFLAAEGFHSATKRSLLGPSSYVLWGLGVAVGYQGLIWLAALDGNWVFTAPRDNFFDANREGILGCVGFFSLYLMGVGVGAFLASSSPPLHSTGTRRSLQGDETQRDTRRDKENKKAGEHSLRGGREESQASSSCSLFFQTSYGIFSVLFGGSVVFFFSYLLLSLGLGVYPTRRLNNLPWVILVASLNFFAISGLIFGEICLGDWKRVYISRMLEGISFNQIVIFLLANLMSGLVGICIKTLLLPPIFALGILVLYSLLWSSIGFLLGQARTIIRLSC